MDYGTWSIGIYSGNAALDLSPDARAENPVLSAADVTDISAQFVADPFMICVDAAWYMFFEVFNRATQKGELGLATSPDGIQWSYRRIVLSEPFHLSYPHLARLGNEIFLVPECYRGGAVRIYRATDFPFSWTFAGCLMDKGCVDPSLFEHENLWWMFWAEPNGRHDTLHLSFAHELFGLWTEHPASPVIARNSGSARPAGKVLSKDDVLIRFAQDCSASYGNSVRAFEITLLTETQYAEREHRRSPVLRGSGTGWNAAQMHHIDAHQLSEGRWIACVDGLAESS
jgi:hypothetical protein